MDEYFHNYLTIRIGQVYSSSIANLGIERNLYFLLLVSILSLTIGLKRTHYISLASESFLALTLLCGKLLSLQKNNRGFIRIIQCSPQIND